MSVATQLTQAIGIAKSNSKTATSFVRSENPGRDNLRHLRTIRPIEIVVWCLTPLGTAWNRRGRAKKSLG